MNLATACKISWIRPPPSSTGQHLQLQPSNHTNALFGFFFQIWWPNSLLDVPQVLFEKVANVAFSVPNVHERDSWCSQQTSIDSEAVFLPICSCDMLPPFLAGANSRYANFRARRIPPANPAWSSNHASDHTSKIDNAAKPNSKTSDWCHDGIENFQFGKEIGNGMDMNKINRTWIRHAYEMGMNGNWLKDWAGKPSLVTLLIYYSHTSPYPTLTCNGQTIDIQFEKPECEIHVRDLGLWDLS